jgi:hypothetical protein
MVPDVRAGNTVAAKGLPSTGLADLKRFDEGTSVFEVEDDSQ